MSTPLLDLRRALGRDLAAHRKRRGWTQQKLGDALSRDRSSIAHIEQGEQSAPRSFWADADALFDAGGHLLRAHQELVRFKDEASPPTRSTDRVVPDGSWSLGDTLIKVVASWHESTSEPDRSGGLPSVESNALHWLLASAPPDRTSRLRGWRTIGCADIDRLRAVRAQLKDIDNTLGGGAALPMALAYLRAEVPRLLDGQYAEVIGKQLVSVLAEMTLDVGWMAYDSGHQTNARRHMLRALRLSQAADDKLFGARVAAALSHQALHLGRTREAVSLASAARDGLAHHAPPAAMAMATTMEACAHAAQSDEARCVQALRAAEAALARARPGDTEGLAWLEFDEGALAGHAARAWRDLRRPKPAIEFGTYALEKCLPGHGRTRAQRRAILATACVQVGDTERAASLGNEMIDEAWRLHSGHVRTEVHRLAQLIERRRPRDAATFLQRANELRQLSA